ncbi:ufm1-specific protease 2-like [Glandiceps talaboti]
MATSKGSVKIYQDSVINKVNRYVTTVDEDDDVIGFLIGITTNTSRVIVSCTACKQLQSFSEELKKTQYLIPAGLEICGLFYVERCPPSPANVLRKCKKLLSSKCQDLINVDKLLVLHLQHGNEITEESSFFWYHSNQNQADDCNIEIIDDAPLHDSMLMFRVQPTFTVEFAFEKKQDVLESLALEMEILQEKVSSLDTVYHVKNSNIVIHCDEEKKESRVTEISEDAPCVKILEYIQIENDDGFDVPGMKGKGGKKGGKKTKTTVESINVQVLSNLSRINGTNTTPLLQYENRDLKSIAINLPCHAVIITDKNTPVSQLPSLFSNGLCNQLKAMQECLFLYYKAGEFSLPEVFHFSLPTFPHFITTVYPKGKSEDELESYRKDLHCKLLLPVDRPMLRRANRFVFADDPNKSVYLKNTHVGLPPSGVDDGRVYLVHGTYAYHHYMQDHMDDNGWGCAYRSLQTICSWFRHQGYTEKSIPTHREIQQALVDVGDKTPKFVGSRQWIGSIEVSTCLDQILGITSKIMFVNNGAELGNKGRELALHFQIQGTPIMIGGGVLAHTILGVEFSDITGEVKFLILDPHYTGSEDLKTIQDKGWCGWKGSDFWDQQAYYNLCMPQSPAVI